MEDYKFDRTDSELEWWLLFCIAVAGKTAKTTRAALNSFFTTYEGHQYEQPFEYVRNLLTKDLFTIHAKMARLGQYSKIERAFREVVTKFNSGADLRTVTVEELESIHGIGPKTARFFLMSTRPKQRYAALDVHILKFIRSKGYNAPKSTPSGKKYSELEEIFLKLADDEGKEPSVLDSEIWMEYSKGW